MINVLFSFCFLLQKNQLYTYDIYEIKYTKKKSYIFVGSSVPGALAGKVREAVPKPGGFQCCSHQVYRAQEGGGEDTVRV